MGTRGDIWGFVVLVLAVALLPGCDSKPVPVKSVPAGSATAPVGGASLSGRLTSAPQVVNVSHYDPKERQRRGASYSVSDLSALRRNGALGLIARCGKGRELDEKCASFLAAAERQGMRLGSYYFVLDGVDPAWQADRFINRLRAIKSARRLRSNEILLVGDFDQASSASDIVRFIDRIEKRTGALPMIYLENSKRLRATLSRATAAQKRRIRQCPYWLALYSDSEPGMETPARLMAQYGIWDRWVLWQYGGVLWDKRRGRSQAKYYNAGRWRSPPYFGDLDRPLERNAFNGSTADLHRFWAEQSWKW